MVGVFLRHDRKGMAYLALVGELPAALKVQHEVRVVRVAPRVIALALGKLPPRQGAAYDYAPAQPVESDSALEPRVVAHDALGVFDGLLNFSGLAVERECVCPFEVEVNICVLVRLSASVRLVCRIDRIGGALVHAHIREVCVDTLKAFGEHRASEALILHGKVAHRLIARSACDLLLLLALIHCAELVYAHEVEGVAQRLACRVCGMVGVEELAPVLHDRAARRAARGVGVARLTAPCLAFIVHVREEGGNGFLNVVCAAEFTDDARLGRGVALLLRVTPDHFILSAAGRPQRHITPRVIVPVHAQHLIGVERISPVVLEHRVRVLRVARPVHKPLRLIR